MPSFVASEEPQITWAPQAATPLGEVVWQAWSARGRARDRRSSAARITAVMWASIAALLAAAGLWSHPAPFEIAVRFLLSAGAMVVLFQAAQARYYVVAAAVGALAVFYNPAVTSFSFSHGWQRAVVAATAVPFAVSLAWSNGRNEYND